MVEGLPLGYGLLHRCPLPDPLVAAHNADSVHVRVARWPPREHHDVAHERLSWDGEEPRSIDLTQHDEPNQRAGANDRVLDVLPDRHAEIRLEFRMQHARQGDVTHQRQRKYLGGSNGERVGELLLAVHLEIDAIPDPEVSLREASAHRGGLGLRMIANRAAVRGRLDRCVEAPQQILERRPGHLHAIRVPLGRLLRASGIGRDGKERQRKGRTEWEAAHRCEGYPLGRGPATLPSHSWPSCVDGPRHSREAPRCDRRGAARE